MTGPSSKTSSRLIYLESILSSPRTWPYLLKIYSQKIKINYTGLEAFPLDEKLLTELNYVDLVSDSFQLEKPDVKKIFQHLHSSEWEKDISISENFTLHKTKNTLEKVEFKNSFD